MNTSSLQPVCLRPEQRGPDLLRPCIWFLGHSSHYSMLVSVLPFPPSLPAVRVRQVCTSDIGISRYKAWKLVGLHPVCAVLFTVGYALREYGSYNYLYDVTTNLPLIIFVLSQVFIFVCP